MLPTATIVITQILSCKTNQKKTDPLVYPLSIPGQKLSRCSPPARKRLGIALLLVFMSPWTLPYLLHPTCQCLPAPLLYHSLTSNIHIPTMTASSPGQLTQCLIHLLLTSALGVSWPPPRAARYRIQVHTDLSFWWSITSLNSRSRGPEGVDGCFCHLLTDTYWRDCIYVCSLCACSRISLHSECQRDPDWEQQHDEYQRLPVVP